MHIFHKWSEWAEYTTVMYGGLVEARQRRQCSACGKIEDVFITFRGPKMTAVVRGPQKCIQEV